MTTKRAPLVKLFTTTDTPQIAVLIGPHYQGFLNLDQCVRSYGTINEAGIRNSHELEGVIQEGSVQYSNRVSFLDQINGRTAAIRSLNIGDVAYIDVVPGFLKGNALTPFFTSRNDWDQSTVMNDKSSAVMLETATEYVLLNAPKNHISFGSGEVIGPNIATLADVRKHSPEAIIAVVPKLMEIGRPVRLQDVVQAAYVPIVFASEANDQYVFPKVKK